MSLFIDRRLTIDSSSLCEAITIDANEKSHIFSVAAPADEPVQLIGLTLANGRAVWGGAVCNIGATLYISRSTLVNNAVGGSSGHGGAVYSYKGTLTVDETVFRWNGAIDRDGKGGAVHVYYGTASVANSAFEGNTASLPNSSGGAMYVVLANADVTNSVFIGNTARGDGGAIYVNSAVLTLANSTLHANISDDGRRGIFVGLREANVTINGVIPLLPATQPTTTDRTSMCIPALSPAPTI